MSTPTFGMTFTRPEDEPVPVRGGDFSKALIIETSPDASAEDYPIGEPVRISTSDPDALAGLGTGYLADAVRGINSQLTGLNSGADVVIVRVEEDDDEDPAVALANTSAAIVEALQGSASIPSAVNMTPRLIFAGRTAWRPDEETANPVIAALPAVCERFLAIAPVDVDDSSSALAIDARETMNSQRLMPIGVAGRVFEGAEVVTRPMAPRVVGLFMRVDNLHGGRPFNPIANRPLQGLAGLSRNINFSLLDGSTEGQQMLESEVSIVARGESGVDGAVGDGGFVFIGTDNTDTGELWKQIHQVRAADYLTVKMIQITQQFLGRRITADIVEAWLSSIKFMLRDHKAADDILGYDVQFRPDRNSPEQIRLGHLTVNLGIEPAPAFKLANHEVRRYRPAIEGMVAEIVARLQAV
ncbi:MAG: phage tail protein [Mesorhizobium sp.]|nr:phage tail protein [Mesorhizobium sp.]